MHQSILETPLGNLHIKADNGRVCSIGFTGIQDDLFPNEITELARIQFEEYFNLSRVEFDFPMQQPGTQFQQGVWNELQQIEPGNPISYAALAKRMHNPLAIRAIASANGKNSLMIAVPCHRVVGSNGDLVGFSAGLWRKKWLLEHETKLVMKGQATLW